MDTKKQLKWLLVLLVPFSILAIVLASVPLMVLGAVVWVGWGAYYILITRVFLPDGSSTPSVAQHSNIETMEVRGEYLKAAAAYRQVIVDHPADVVACEKLGQLAMRQLKDYETAIWAYRQAEERIAEPRRKLGYALIVAGLYRDNLHDNGKAIVELRKVLEKYPDSPNAGQVKTELDELRARHFEAR